MNIIIQSVGVVAVIAFLSWPVVRLFLGDSDD